MSSIFDKIDALSEWAKAEKGRTPALPKKFIADLQEILTALAFHATTTDETAAEDWHTSNADNLATEFSSESKNNKPRKKTTSDIPPSLRSIMNGTHQSFKS